MLSFAMLSAREKSNWFKQPTNSQLAIFTSGWVVGNALLLAAATDFFTDFHQWHNHPMFLLLMGALSTWGVVGFYGNYFTNVKNTA